MWGQGPMKRAVAYIQVLVGVRNHNKYLSLYTWGG
jgi:hypothetical protein